ncbi:hypothetical protein FO014_23275 [Serratia rhizosphaerae]|uniref:Uncharacterized protein n=1 Tax=Serratia rhizosphaerae TaxID=2597702 RepID=A0ABX6GTR5_9GAMM|nr:hypothetical protein FO014_23275 [Serratia rhizosphaerae]
MLTSVWTTKLILTKSKRVSVTENGALCAPFFYARHSRSARPFLNAPANDIKKAQRLAELCRSRALYATVPG